MWVDHILDKSTNYGNPFFENKADFGHTKRVEEPVMIILTGPLSHIIVIIYKLAFANEVPVCPKMTSIKSHVLHIHVLFVRG
jgi:hypothetical protein